MVTRRALLAGLAAQALCGRAMAQIPAPPYAYIRGTDIARDTLSGGKVPLPKGLPDLWLRANFQNLGYYLGRPGWGIHIKHLILRTKGGPFHQWDTIPNSGNPLLRIESGGKVINAPDGSIAGFSPPTNDAVELFIADIGGVGSRHIPLELEVVTLDGSYVMNVALSNFNDSKPL